MPGMNGNRQHPCSKCGCDIASDDMFDVIMQQRLPREDRRSNRSSVAKYLPPVRMTIAHVYLCKTCGEEFLEFLKTYGGDTFVD